jgi:small nuclear ribonucleoprotein (snRNP)-like protein
VSVAQRKYFTEVAALSEKVVSVTTTTGKTFTGTLLGINPDNLSLALADAKEEAGKTVNRLFLNGNTVAQISTAEKSFDLKALSQGFIWVMDKVKLTEKGVIEGSGPAAERVQKVYQQFVSEAKV